MKNNMGFLGLFVAVLVLLPGCLSVPVYKCRPLQSINDQCAYRGIEKNVIVQAKKLSLAEQNYLFEGRIEDEDFNVIYISIHNMSEESYVFSCDDIGVKQIPYQAILKSMKRTNSFVRLVGGAFASTYFIGFSKMIFCLGTLVAGPLVYVIIPAGVLATAFFAQGIKSIKMNKKIRKDLEEKSLHKRVMITSGGHYEGLIFVKSSEYTSQFTLTLHEHDSIDDSLVFNINLN